MSRASIFALLAGGLLAVASCASGPEPSGEFEAPDAPSPDLESSKCLGNRVPPTNYRQVTVFEPISTQNAFEVAKTRAVRQLRDRICQGFRCSSIESKITLWHTEADEVQACAMAVVKTTDVEAFENAPRRELKKNLEASAHALVKASGAESPIFALDAIRDNGVEGGSRAEWLIDRMSAALTKHGAALAKTPQGWTGLKPPPGSAGILRGRITRMHGREMMLEVTWSLDVGNAMKSVDAVVFPEFIGPVVDPSTVFDEVAPSSRDVALRFASRPGGGLCDGEVFKMYLETARPLHVQVLNLYGKGEDALVIWSSDDPVKPGNSNSLGEFQAIAGEVPAERFVVLAATQAKTLGDVSQSKAPCRLPADYVSKVVAGDLPDGVAAASRGYRIVDSADCPQSSLPEVEVPDISTYPMCF